MHNLGGGEKSLGSLGENSSLKIKPICLYLCRMFAEKGNERRKGELRRTEHEKRRTDNEQLFDKSTTLIEKKQSSE